MIGVDAHIVTLEVKGKLAVFDMLQFILMQVRPPPQPGIDDMREAFTSSHLGFNTTTTEEEYRSSSSCKSTVLRAEVKHGVKSIIGIQLVFHCCGVWHHSSRSTGQQKHRSNSA